MRDFVILFEEKEGTSPLVRMLDRFAGVSIVHQQGGTGWEPFDRHNCGQMSIGRMQLCFELLFSGDPQAFDAFDALYRRSARRGLARFERPGSVGFKMRFTPATNLAALGRRSRLAAALARGHHARFRRAMLELFARRGVAVFVAVRQDLLRWALSKYHGDGKGNRGHLQFQLADGTIQQEQIGRIDVDCDRLERIIEGCEASHRMKRRLIADCRDAGVTAAPLCYEHFLSNKTTYFQRLFEVLGGRVDQAAIQRAVDAGEPLRKVHSDHIADFVSNHAEVERRFGDRFAAWSTDTDGGSPAFAA